MSRLEKKCFIAATGIHAFLLLVVLFGSAFFVAKQQPEMRTARMISPSRMPDDGPTRGGGNPKVLVEPKVVLPPAAPPASAKPIPTPIPPRPVATPPSTSQAKPPERPRADPKHEKPPPVKPPKHEVATEHTHSPLEPVMPKLTPKASPNKPVLELTPVVKNHDEADRKRLEQENQRIQKEIRARQEHEEQEWKAYNDRVAHQIGNATELFRTARDSKQTQVDIPGPDGTAFVNYAEYVRAKYEAAWIVSDSLTDEESTARVIITIARNGKVVAAKIERRSANPALDRSVQRALDRVTFIAPFPEGSADEQRTFTINFNLKAKRLSG